MKKISKISTLLFTLVLLFGLANNAHAYDTTDFTNLVSNWLRTITGSPVDVNSDGKVNSRDLGIMMSNWDSGGVIPPPPATGCNTQINGAFEQNTTDWGTDGGSSTLSWQNQASGDGSTGYMRFNIADNGDYDRLAFNSTDITAPNTTYQVSFWYRTSGITGNLQVFSTDDLGSLGSTSWASSKIAPSASWEQYSTTLTTDGTSYPIFGISKLGSIGAGTLDIDGISVCGGGTTPTPTPGPGPCPGMPTVAACPSGQERYVTFTSPECGIYYGCRDVTSNPSETCGNGSCAGSESCSSCQTDCGSCPVSDGQRPLVGVIRYNQFYKDGDSDTVTLSPNKWHDRIPWCLDMAPNVVSGSCDSQSEYDQDMQYAMTAGIDYFAQLYNGNSQLKPIQYHLASPYKDQVKFSVIIMQWDAERWASRIDNLISYFQDSSYQKVLNGRPLVYIFDPGILESYYGQGAGTRAKINEIRTKAQAAGLPNPYIVTMAGGIEEYGLDAVSRYLYIGPGEEHQGYPFANHMFPNIAYWDDIGYDQIPNVSLGYDERPRWEIPPPWGTGGGPWFEQPTAAETNQIVGAGLDWVKQHPSRAPANSILIYGWDEVAEGGWLVPTYSEGDTRVRSLGNFLRAY